MAEMTDLERLPERVERIEQKLDVLSESVEQRFADVNARFDGVDKRFEAIDRRFEAIDRRFDEVSEHFVEQREYTEFAFDRLRKEMIAGFTRLEGLIATNTRGLGRLESKLDRFIAAYEPPGQGRRARRPPKKRS